MSLNETRGRFALMERFENWPCEMSLSDLFERVVLEDVRSLVEGSMLRILEVTIELRLIRS